ncbi:MAG: hypothetical protein AAGI68_03895 [Planctomycetota bacterium]
MRPFDPRLVGGPALVTAATLAWAAIVSAQMGNTEFLFYVVVMLVLAGLVAYAHWRVCFSAGVLWALTGWGVLHMAGGLVAVPESWPINGDVRVLYSWWIIPIGDGSGGAGVGQGGWLKYDHLVHAYGFGVSAWACWQGLCAAVGRRLCATCGRLMLVGLAAMGLGALNELVEFVATMLGPSNVGGYVNTGWDLAANGLGVGVALVVLGVTQR